MGIRRSLMLVLAVGFVGCPKPTPTPTPTPPPPPPECECSAPASELPGWTGTTVDVPYNEAFIATARDALGDRCDKDENETLALMAKQLATQSVCAVGPWADALLVARPDGVWEEWHVVEWQRGCWYPLSKAFKGAWVSTFAKVPKKGCK